MITPNTDFTFIQVKSDNPRTFTWQNGTVVEVVEMTAQRPIEKSSVSIGTKHESEVYEQAGSLDDLLLIAVDEALKQVFKAGGAKVIYGFLENKFHLGRKGIASRPEDFCVGLQRLLGSAAPVIEKLILENLHSKLGLKFKEKEGYGFSDYLKELREKYRC